MCIPHHTNYDALFWCSASVMVQVSTEGEVERNLISNADVDVGFPIVLQRSGKCLEYESDEFEAHLWECHGGQQQLWTYDEASKLIRSSTVTGFCLRAFPYEGGKAYVTYCDPTDTNEQWDYDDGLKTFKLEEYCLDADVPSSFNNGGIVSMRPCNGQTNQKWHLGNSNTEKVLLCRHYDCDCYQFSYRASVGDWNRMPWQIGDNELTDVVIPKGYALQYFEHPDFGGRNQIFGSPDDYVSLNLAETSDNDTVSSFVVRRLPDTGKVKLCRNTDCTGGVFYASVGQWSSMPSEIGDNELSFVHIPQGYFIEYFEHGNWGGWSRKAGSCDRDISLRLTVSNDTVSSFKIGLAC